MLVKSLLTVLFLTLIGCGSEPKKPAQPEAQPKTVQKTKPSVARPRAHPVDSRKNRILEVAKHEWLYFGQQKVVIDRYDESIPHVGIWEDDDPSHSDRINQYWRAVGKNRVSGYDCKEPWSAAFVSWVMQAAGIPEYLFPPAATHRSYVNHFLANASDPYAVWVPHTIQKYKPKPGDLICAKRGNAISTAMVKELPDSLNSKLHCDIVVETKGQTLQAIGGNVRNSVSKTFLTLSPEGYLQLTSHRPWCLVIENRLN